MTRSFLRACLLAAFACALALPLSAQFNGPSVQTGGLLNQYAPLTQDQSLLHPAPRDPQLMQGDQITVKIFGQEDYNPQVRIGTDGNVLLPFIGVVSLDHLTITAAETLIAQRLQQAGMYKSPQVTIQVTDGPNANVTVIGEVHGVVPVVGSRRLLDVLATAGGLTATSSHVVTINRPGALQPIVVDLGTDPAVSPLANVPVFPGDTIVVARTGVIYVMGSFKSQGVIPLAPNTPLTLLEITALSGGPTFPAKYSDLRIIRTVGDRRTVVKLDMKKVLYGKAPDPILQANDIIFLPDSFIKSTLTNGSINSVLSLVSVLFSALALTRSN
jgi:polysaccharide biosynthesis/export protein